MVESRRALRLKVVKAAKTAFGGRNIDCVVRNLSATGAALEVSSHAGISAKFTPVLPAEKLQLVSRIVWCPSYRLGVVFD